MWQDGAFEVADHLVVVANCCGKRTSQAGDVRAKGVEAVEQALADGVELFGVLTEGLLPPGLSDCFEHCPQGDWCAQGDFALVGVVEELRVTLHCGSEDCFDGDEQDCHSWCSAEVSVVVALGEVVDVLLNCTDALVHELGVFVFAFGAVRVDFECSTVGLEWCFCVDGDDLVAGQFDDHIWPALAFSTVVFHNDLGVEVDVFEHSCLFDEVLEGCFSPLTACLVVAHYASNIAGCLLQALLVHLQLLQLGLQLGCFFGAAFFNAVEAFTQLAQRVLHGCEKLENVGVVLVLCFLVFANFLEACFVGLCLLLLVLEFEVVECFLVFFAHFGELVLVVVLQVKYVLFCFFLLSTEFLHSLFVLRFDGLQFLLQELELPVFLSAAGSLSGFCYLSCAEFALQILSLLLSLSKLLAQILKINRLYGFCLLCSDVTR